MPRRIPVPVLRPALEVCAPTGVVLDASRRVIVAQDSGGVGKALAERLQSSGVCTLLLDPALNPVELEARVKAWQAEGTIQGVYWLPALDSEPPLNALEPATWRDANRIRVKSLYTVMRVLYETIKDQDNFLIAGTRLGGLHGYGPDGATAPLGGAVTGFTKAYKRERADAVVKAVDFSEELPAETCADVLLAETLRDPAIVEVGIWRGNRFGIGLKQQPARDGSDGMMLNRDCVFVVTGAAGGITSAIVGDLAASSRGTFFLLDLVPAPDAHDPHIAMFRSSKDQLKQRLIDESKERGERTTPAQIEKQIFAVERAEAALRAIESIEAAGGTAVYRSVNLLDAAAVDAVVAEVRERFGRIDVLVHAAGLEISRSLPDKDAKQFDLVFDVKADGFFNVLHAARSMPIGATIVFSSVAGRFGNAGQTDYSAANDLLCKVTSSLRRRRPETRAIAIDWTAWGGIGMATRGSIPTLMAAAGIELLPPECGVPTVRRELTASAFRGEVLVAGALGALAPQGDESGGLDEGLAQATLAARGLPLVGRLTSASLSGAIGLETTLDPAIQPFLRDHQMDGTPLLPGVMGIELFAECASALAPGFRVAAIENVRFDAPFKFHRMKAQTLKAQAVFEPVGCGDLLAHCVLRSTVPVPRPDLPVQQRVHFTADVRLTPETAMVGVPPAACAQISGTEAFKRFERAAIYRTFFHGPAYQVLERVDVGGDTATGWMAEALPPDIEPADATMLMEPRLIELCFQTIGIWQIAQQGVLALPLALDAVRVGGSPKAGTRLHAQMRARDHGTQFDAWVTDDAGHVYAALKGYRTVALPGAVSVNS